MQRVPLNISTYSYHTPSAALPSPSFIFQLSHSKPKQLEMGRTPCCEKVGLKRGRWTAEEDEVLIKYIQANGERGWRAVPRNAGLRRCGKSCRLRWINYLRPDLKRGNITPQEVEIIISLHASMGNRWSLIAGHLPGRTDNEIKNYWNSHLNKKFHGFISTQETMKPGEVYVKARGDCRQEGDKKGRTGSKKKETKMQKCFLKPVQGEFVNSDSSKVLVPKLNGFNGKNLEAPCSNEESIGSVRLCPESHGAWEGLEHKSRCLNELLDQNGTTIPRAPLQVTSSIGSSEMNGWRCARVGDGKDWYTEAPPSVYDEWVDWPCIDSQRKLETEDEEILSWLGNDNNEI